MKRVFLVIGSVFLVLVVLAVGYRVYGNATVNPRVLEDLRSNPNGERAARAMILWLPDGRELPVNYLHEGDQVFVGADGFWWRQFREGNVPVRLLIMGESFTGRARTVMDDPVYTREVFKRLRPNVPKWLPDWLDAYLIVIDLDSQAGA